MSFRLFLKSFVISLMFCAVLIGIGYFYMQKNLQPAQNQIENVPYEQQTCDSKGVLLEIDQNKTFLYLDFENDELVVSLMPETENSFEIYGYSVDFTVKGDYNFLKDVVDYVGGIELLIDGKTYRYTGIQLAQVYNNEYELKREIIEQVCKKISENGVALDFFANIIENSQTDLTIPDCYFWCEELSSICQNIKVID